VPTRDSRCAILAFESTEGGAGVLGRLVSESHALRHVARAALELMHYGDIDAAIATTDPALLRADPDAECVKGCYRCLLSYYNQPDQELIDRNDPAALRILLRLARSGVTPLVARNEGASASPWLRAFKSWGLPAPHGEPLALDGASLAFVWPEHRVAADQGPFADGVFRAAENMGYAIVALPEAPSDAAPPELAELLGAAP
jgi:Domain of unknown function (DUF1998)